MHGFEGVASKPVFLSLSLEVFQKQFHFVRSGFLRKRNEHVRLAQVAIILENLILKNQVVPERVPR